MTFVLTSRILRERPNGFCGCVVEGRRGIGKSSYCLKIMKEIYQEIYHCSEKEGYEYALKYTLYDIEDIIRTLKDANDNSETIPAITWDDAGVHGSSLQWFINMEQVNELKAITDTIRTAVTGFIINCTDRSGLLSHLRKYDDLLVEIVRDRSGGGNTYTTEQGENKIYKSWERIARGYNIFKLPSGKRMIYKQFEDYYSCYLPKDIYDVYMDQRKFYMTQAIQHMEEMRQENISKKKMGKIDLRIKEIELHNKVIKYKKKLESDEDSKEEAG
jgi:hypothetical protein